MGKDLTLLCIELLISTWEWRDRLTGHGSLAIHEPYPELTAIAAELDSIAPDWRDRARLMLQQDGAA